MASMDRMPDIADKYGSTQIMTAPQHKAVAMLHDKCFQFVVRANREKESIDRRALLDKAQNILSQLQTALSVSDQTSQGLFLLYDYCYQLLEIDSAEPLRNAQQIIKTLRETFNQLLKTR